MAVQRHDTKAGRFYRGDDWGVSPLTGTTDFPSVTHILSVLAKPALVQWSAKVERQACIETAADFYADLTRLPKPMDRATYVSQFEARLGTTKAHQRESAKATDIGTQAHKLIEHTLRKALGQRVGPEPKVRDEAWQAVVAFNEWASEHTIKPVFIETTVYHRRLGYAGTLDLLAEIDGVLSVVDFKTSKSVYEESHLQNAAYQEALIEMGHARPQAGWILRLPKSTEDSGFEAVSCPSRHELLPVFRALCRVWLWWHAAEQRSYAQWQARKNGKAA